MKGSRRDRQPLSGGGVRVRVAAASRSQPPLLAPTYVQSCGQCFNNSRIYSSSLAEPKVNQLRVQKN